MKRLLLALTLLFAPLSAFAQGPGGLGIWLVQDNATTVTGVRQGNFTCGAVVTSGGTGTGIAQMPMDSPGRPARLLRLPSQHPLADVDNNIGATGSVTFTLPAAVAGLWYGFTVDAAQTVEVLGNGTDHRHRGVQQQFRERHRERCFRDTGDLRLQDRAVGGGVEYGEWTVHRGRKQMTSTVRSSPITSRDYSLTVGTTTVTAFTPPQLPGGFLPDDAYSTMYHRLRRYGARVPAWQR